MYRLSLHIELRTISALLQYFSQRPGKKNSKISSPLPGTAFVQCICDYQRTLPSAIIFHRDRKRRPSLHSKGYAHTATGNFTMYSSLRSAGLVLLYAFGTPGCSYEYNNLHAIRVALRILKSSKNRFHRKTGVGIATGNICTGIIGKLNFRLVQSSGRCLPLIFVESVLSREGNA